MRRVRIDKAGGYDRLRFESGPAPSVKAGQVHVKTRAIGVNYADCVVRMGLYTSAKRYVGWPITPGFEVAGVVEAVGSGITHVAPGDRVLAVTRFDGYTTDLVAPGTQVFPLPKDWSFEQGATFPSVFMTAWFAVCELAHPRPGTKALVHSAAGGVGGALLQILRALDCETVGVVGAPHKVESARQFGAQHVIVRADGDLWARAQQLAPQGYGLILDANGVSTLGRSYKHLASPGKLVVYGFHSMLPKGRGKPCLLKLALDWLRTPRFNPLDMTGDNKSVMAFNLSYLFERQDILAEAMARLMGWVDSGDIVPVARSDLSP